MGTRKRLVPQLLVASSNRLTHIIIKRSEKVIAYTKPSGLSHKVVKTKVVWAQP